MLSSDFHHHVISKRLYAQGAFRKTRQSDSDIKHRYLYYFLLW